MADNPFLKTKPFGNPINKIFEDFIEKTLINKLSYLNIDPPISEPIFTADNLKALIEAYVKQFDAGTGTFYEKLKKQLDDAKVSNEAKAVFANLLWLKFLFQEKKIDKQPNKVGLEGECGKDTIEKIKDCTIKFYETCYDSNNGCAPYGMATINVDAEMTDLVLLFYNLVKETEDEKKNEIEDIKKYIICWCLDIKEDYGIPGKDEKGVRSVTYKNKDLKLPEARKSPKTLLPLHNMLLYVCKHEHYDNISVSGDKNKIAKAFESILKNKSGVIDLEPAKDIIDNADNINKKIYCIYKKLEENGNQPQIYFEPYRSMWRNEGTELDAIKFKKALILYGPPGTSKTYTAKELSKTIIRQINYASDVKGYLENLNNGEIDKRIHRLQLHPNYTYEDFVWGYQIENEKYDVQGNVLAVGQNLQCIGNKTTPKKGYFLRLLDVIAQDNESTLTEIKKLEENKKNSEGDEIEKKLNELKDQLKVHVLILDEINRVDLSRLFGELFSAIENRDEAIDLPVVIEGMETKEVLGQKVTQISIPQNLYIIGTMNEIDFSLERVDFALRRRFIWKYYGYNPDALYSIITEKKAKYRWSKPDDDDLVEYGKRCKDLNDAIEKDPDLGKQFEIGHTFFGELVDIWATKSSSTHLKTIQDVLWNISIEPMVEAYLGNCDADTKKKKLEGFKQAFIPELKKDNGKTEATEAE